ncbi:MAG: hypothetical protein CMI01_15175 [Oceanospirillaceae bacterium]|nr:hypothetical protein [Oceanospirillaceae bacterium]
MMRILLLCLTGLWLSLAGTAMAAHPLTGKIWSPKMRHFISEQALLQDWMPNGGWLLIGEQHDNPDHHRIQADLIRLLGTENRLGNVALEMANRSQQPLLDNAKRTPELRTPENLEWSDGWPWALYQEPLMAAFQYAPRIIGADLNPTGIKRAYQQGAPDGELEPAHADYMLDLLFDSHCRQMPRQQLEPMRQVQLARDQQLASALRDNTEPGRVNLLLTGSIHARKDLGVPRWLDTTPHITLLLISAEPNINDPAAYQPVSFGNLDSADLILFTQPLEAPDYCARFQRNAN